MPKIIEEPEALDDFDEWGAWLRRAYRGGNAKLPRRSGAGRFRVRCYSYYRKLKNADLCEALIAHVSDRDPGKWKHPATDLGWVLRLAEGEDQQLLTASTRMRIAAELEFAEELDVPPSRLLGFLYEAGGYEQIRGFGGEGSEGPPDFLKGYANSQRTKSRRAA